MAGTNILVRQKDLIAGSGISITPDTTSGNVTIAATSTAIDETRLLPTGGKNGNILEYQEGVDRGNDVNTKLLIQPATSDGLIVDQAAGNAAPVGITNSGNVAIVANALVFSGENALIIEPDTLGMTLGGNNEYSIEVDFQLDQVKSDWATLFGGDGSMTRSAFYINSSGATAVQGGIAPDTTGWTTGTRHRLTIERFQDGDSWRTVIYRNGAVLATSATTPNTLSGDRFPIGSNLEGTGRNFVGKIWAFRISNKAEHRGVSFIPRELPFLPPAGQPVWTEGIDRSRLLPKNPVNGDIPCFDATATVGGGIDDDTHLMLHFDEESGIPADSSQVEILVTANDTAADAATAKFGKARNLNNSYLSLTCPAMSTGTGDFTYEGWFYFNELNKRRGLFGVDMGLYVALWEDNTFGVAISTSGRSWNYNYMDYNRSEATATQGVWQHIALVRNKGNVTLYLNGNSILSFDIGADTVITGNMGNNPFRIGYPLGGMSYVADFCDEFRFSTVARWTGNFTPPDAPYSKQVIEGEWGKFNKSELVKSVNGQTPDSSGAVTIPAATASAAGLMAAADKNALDNLRYATQAGAINFNSFSGLNACYTLLNGAHTNGPLTGTYSGTLDIISDRTSYVTTQRFTQLTTNKSFIRTYAFDTSTLKGTWSEWSKVIVNTDIATTSAAGLMTATDKVKLDALQQGATYIDTATDFDTYKTTGSYFLKSAAHTNGPLTDSYAGTLVAVGPSSVQYATQYFTQLYTNKTFVRNYSQDNSAWSAWRRIIVDTDLATTTAAGLMAAADKAAIAGLTAQGIYPNVAIATAGSGIDYNLFKTQGTFYIPYYTVVSNGPVSAGSGGTYPGGFLSVLQANLSGGISVQQIFHLHANNKAYIRSYNGDTDTWSAWNRVIVDTDLATTTVAGLMSATDREKSIGLTTRGFYPNALAKSGAVDFNEVIDHGFYFIGGDTPHLNYPETYQQNGGTLQVIRNGNYLTQTFIPLNINTVFIRTCVNALSDSSARTFSAWRRALTNTEITESKALPGYFKLPGGTIVQWGNFEVTADPQTQEITLPVALSSVYVRQASGCNSALRIGIYGGPGGKITCYVDGKTSGTVGWMVIGK